MGGGGGGGVAGGGGAEDGGHGEAEGGPVTIADREAEEAMDSVILKSFPSHAVFSEENGWRCIEKSDDYVCVLDPMDGTKSFITGKPLFGTLISLLYNGKPVF
ncbi:Os09g0322900 [Oryza sativa Japonica Group]|uniref:Os09g0322900 protein n=1 Tax=Oryza sativa subsp. japonica TaxID=39947 RepID=Q0J2N0_ORYSJ|nr:Os09g0322900 [Oryza sativa Japonica Group]|eukprot:NP_001062868.2 Os09g0322900 [Oryza sativa Japonica Group]